MQKVQRWSQPFCTWTKARERPVSVDQVQGLFAHRHDVVDRDLLAGSDAEIGPARQGLAGLAPGLGLHLLVIADDPVDLRHGGEDLGLGLRGAAGDDDAGGRVFALQPADRLPRLASRLAGDRAGVDDDGLGQPGLGGEPLHDLGFRGVEPAAEGDDLDRGGTGVHGVRRPWQKARARRCPGARVRSGRS